MNAGENEPQAVEVWRIQWVKHARRRCESISTARSSWNSTALLRNGNVAGADDRRSVLEPVVARYRDLDSREYFHGDAAFAIPELYAFLEAESCL